MTVTSQAPAVGVWERGSGGMEELPLAGLAADESRTGE
jgi:hypothetical protein